ncbi:hypothetical protein DER44DRAFT_816448 [Fusarium oxysporum]|nr:hypothetical protein DER44DRAFT_816448 [Fusarium oxysporum]
MKRSRDSTDDQNGSHAQKKFKNGISIPFVHLSKNDIETGSVDFTTNMYSSRNNKRNIDEMNGQLDPESDRPAKRLHHDHVMQEEVIMHSPRNNKRNREELGGQVEPDSDRSAKRVDRGQGVTWADNVDGPRSNKRNIDEMKGQLGLESDRPAKRLDHGYNTMPAASDHDIMQDEAQPNQGLGGEMTVYANRVRVYHRLLEIDIDENLCNALKRTQLDEKFRRTIIDLMSDIERQKGNNDPKSALPTIMTDSLARERVVGTRTCVKTPVDVEDVVWKDCGAHLMHLECFRRQVLKARCLSRASAACIDNVC